jgi:hypothetical protein
MAKRLPAAAALAALLLLGCSRERLGPPPEGAHRRTAKAITYYLDRSASDELELGVREAFQLWTDATDFKFSYGGRTGARVARDGRNEVVIARKWPNELAIGQGAWCQVYLDKAGAIAEADILLNAQAFTFTTRREAKAGSVYIEDLLAKQIGRSLGIGFGEEAGKPYRIASAGDGFEPGIDPAQMAAYLSLYAASPDKP